MRKAKAKFEKQQARLLKKKAEALAAAKEAEEEAKQDEKDDEEVDAATEGAQYDEEKPAPAKPKAMIRRLVFDFFAFV
jgi:hypothetical protein